MAESAETGLGGWSTRCFGANMSTAGCHFCTLIGDAMQRAEINIKIKFDLI